MSIHYVENYSLLMALVDFVPVVFFFLSGQILMEKNKDNVILTSGIMMVFVAGLLKAIWKLLACLNICDFVLLNQMFLPVNAIGFLFVGVGLIKCDKILSLTPIAPFSGSIIFIICMTIGELLLAYSLIKEALKKKKFVVVSLVLLSFVLAMSMGGLAAIENKVSVYTFNWCEEIINSFSQISLFVGLTMMKK